MSSGSTIQWIDKVAGSDLTSLFNINAPQFLALANSQQFAKLKQTLIKIDIQEAIKYLKAESYLEITIPVLGMADFLAVHLKNSIWNQIGQAFPSVISVNGWGSGEFSRPDFILVRDIIGNEYEILVNSEGQVEIPEEGSGLFSMLSEITLMYSASQILKGRGFEALSEVSEVEPNQVYLLPPPNSSAAFTVTIRTTHLDADYQSQVDFEQIHFFGVNPDGQQAGLTEFGARSLVRHLFSEFDFIKSFLDGKGELDFGIVRHKNFNDFRLSYEALGVYYNLLLKAVIHQRLPAEFILSKVPNDRFATLSSIEGPFDEEDRHLIQTVGGEALAALSHFSPRRPTVLNQSIGLESVNLEWLSNQKIGEQNNCTKFRK